MSNTLIIVESPSKAKTISKFVSSDYSVIASKGHIRDLPKNRLGISIENGHFEPDYEISKTHAGIVKELKSLSKGAKVLLATDEDREGEAIAYHLANILGGDVLSYDRIVFHEITKDAILNAIKHPRKIDLNSVNAQQARRMLDRIVGFKLSGLLSSKVASKLSAGRVQSAALRLIVLKEREIRNFVSIEYYELDTKFKQDLEVELIEYEGKKIAKTSLTDKALADEILKHIKGARFSVDEVNIKERKDSPKPPFMTSTLQQAASSKLGFSPKKTMMLAQTLYEGVQTHAGFMGAITYMRTDSLNLSEEAIKAAREQINKDYGKEYVPNKARIYETKNKGAQEAHEAIRVTNTAFTPAIAKEYLKPDEYKLYKLIYDRFLMTQMADARIENNTIYITSDKAKFKLSGRRVLFDGHLKLNDDASGDIILPNLNKGDEMTLQSAKVKTLHTEPPARYNEASLIKQLEVLGIGRPSTYAPTTSLLIDRDYVNVEKKQLIPSEKGEKIIEFLEEHFSVIVDAKFTSTMEERLDEIATHGRDLDEVLNEFYEPFIAKINDGKTSIQSQKQVEKLGENCPDCGKELLIREGRFGKFIACSGYPKCKYSRNLNETANETKEEKPKKEVVKLEVPCPKCGGDLVQRFSKRGAFYGCSNYPKCNFISSYALAKEKCECGGTMIIKELKKGTFLECLECKQKTNKE